MNKSVKFWDSQAIRYDDVEDQFDYIYTQMIENTKKHLKASDVVLDYACGTGNITFQIADHVKEVHAIDLSSGMIDVATRKAKEHNAENVQFTQSTLFETRYDAHSFDVILAFNILHLLKDLPEAIQKINELLKPGGHFISATACMGEKRSLFGMSILLLSKIGIVPYVKKLKIAQLESAIMSAGFQIIETEHLSQKPSNYFIVAKK